MEAVFFRSLAEEMARDIAGMRIEKVHGPAEDVNVLALYGPGRNINLIHRPAKPAGLLFLSAQRPPNPKSAPARVMWLRKRLTGRRILDIRADWPNLRLAVLLSPRDMPASGPWLVFDLRGELTLAPGFDAPPAPAWPELARILDDPGIWRGHPQLSPALRKHMAALAATNPSAAQTLLSRLATGQPEGFSLPPTGAPTPWQDNQPGAQRFDTAMAAATAHGERTLFPQLAAREDAPAQDEAAQARKRLARQLDLLDKDEARHRALAQSAIQAEALQVALSALRGAPRCERMTLDHPQHGPVDVRLDPRLTPVENMARLFGLAAKGRRGLEHVARRRALLVAMGGTLPAAPGGGVQNRQVGIAKDAPVLVPKRYQGLAVACFRTSDGFLAVRGKNSQANHDILAKAASPHDYWLHAEGGPSAHIILRRDYPGQPVPDRSLEEAAILCANKSWRKDDAKAVIMCARVRDVRKVKGAAIGSVVVDEVERTLTVTPDPALEERLALRQAVLPAEPGKKAKPRG